MADASERVTLDYAKQVGDLPPEGLIRFYELFAHGLTISIRAIW
jgi:hypothetical protein